MTRHYFHIKCQFVEQIERRKKIAELNLTPKERKFCESYLINFDPRVSAVDAGYKVKDFLKHGKSLLVREKIQTALKLLEEELADRVDLKDEDIIKELMIIGFSDIGEFYDLKSKTLQFKEISKMDPVKRRAIQEISKIVTGKSTTYKIKLHPKTPILEMMLQHRGLTKPSKETPPVKPPDSKTILQIKEARILLADPLNRKVVEELSAAFGENPDLRLKPGLAKKLLELTDGKAPSK